MSQRDRARFHRGGRTFIDGRGFAPGSSGGSPPQMTVSGQKSMSPGQQTVLNPDLGYKIMVAIRLGVDSYREGKVKFFDAGTQKPIERGSVRASYEGDGKNSADSKYNKRRG